MTAPADTPVESSTAAPYPSDTLAKGWRFELHMEQIEQSDTWLRARNGLNRAYLLMLWAKAWSQKPCGSLPNDDELIALMLDMDDDEFAKRKAVLMRGWWLADDGRLYHTTITERVLEMLAAKSKERLRKAAYRARLSQGSDVDSAGHGGESHGNEGMSHGTAQGQTGDSHGSDPGRDGTSTGTSTSTSNKSSSLRSEDKPRKQRKRSSRDDCVSADQLVAEGVDAAHARDWLVVRREKKLPLTPTAWQGTKDEAAKAGITPGEAVHIATENSWGGFKATWMTKAETRLPDSFRGGGGSGIPNRQEQLEDANFAAAAAFSAGARA